MKRMVYVTYIINGVRRTNEFWTHSKNAARATLKGMRPEAKIIAIWENC